jgi:radical SAM superfamily enzyme YgiQ (UPF0313 family)
MLTPKYKTKPVARVMAEIHAIRQIWPYPYIEFADDNTFVDRRHSKALLRAMAPERLRWFTETDISIADDPELLELMRISGCAEVLIGLESPTAEGIDHVEQRKNWKRSRFDDYKDAIARIQGHGIAVNGCFVMGLDGDGPELFENIERFVEESGQFDVQITVMTPYPGTPLYERLTKEGRLLEEGAWERCTLFDVNHVPKGMSPEMLHREGLALGLRLYTEDQRKARAKRFRDQRREYVRSHRREEVLA